MMKLTALGKVFAPEGIHTSTRLSEADYRRGAARLGCTARQLKAVVAVEAAGAGFTSHLGTVVPKVLFEAHHFYRLSGAYPISREFPHLSSPRWNRSLYNKLSRPLRAGEDMAHARLSEAVALDARYKAGGSVRDAALMASSWGIGQVMGYHYRSLGFDTVQAFVNANYASEGSQLDIMVEFIRTNGLADDVRRISSRAGDCAGFAKGYNGSGYAVHGYHRKIASAFARGR
jgi:hypothetical protein